MSEALDRADPTRDPGSRRREQGVVGTRSGVGRDQGAGSSNSSARTSSQRPWRRHTALDSEGSSVGRISRWSFVRCRIARVSFSPAMVTESVHTGPTRTATTATGSPRASHARSCCHPLAALRRRSNGVAGYPGPVTGHRAGAGPGGGRSDAGPAWWSAV